MGKETMSDLLALVHDPAFGELNRRLDKDVFTWLQFKELEMPEGYSALEVWTFFSAMRRQTAHLTPFKSWYMPENDLPVWCSLNSLIAVELEKIISACENRQNRPRDGASGVAHYRHLHRVAEDLSAALDRDGVAMPPEEVYAVMIGYRTPESADERLVLNAYGLLADGEKITRRRMSQWTIDDMIGALGEGCDGLDAGWPTNRPFDNPPSMPAFDDVSRMLCDILNESGQADKRNFLIDMLCFSGTMRDLKPFERWNGIMEMILRHLYLRKAGLSLLEEVPYSKLFLDWDRDELDPRYGVTQGFDDVNPYVGEDADVTPFIGFSLRIISEYLRLVQKTEEEDEANAPLPAEGLNSRQAHLLGLLKGNPLETITFAKYMTFYDVSRGTARNDLHDLADRGMLEESYQGRAIVFSLDPNTDY